jgi:glycosyltransferase involved in cell wall biosynthesis
MLQLARELKSSVEVAFILNETSPAQNLAKRVAAEGFSVQCLPHDARFEAAFKSALRQKRPDLLHIHAGIGWEGGRAPEAARQAGVGAIVRTEHLPYLIGNESERRAYFAALPLLDAIICVSQSARDTYAHAGVPSERLHVVRNGIAFRRAAAARDATRRTLGLTENEAMVLMVARLTEQKGHKVVLAAVPHVLAHRPSARFFFAGAGPLEGALRDEIAARDLGAHVTLLGERSDIPELLAAADLFVLPSLFEGLPLSLLEAYAAGLPVVAARASGTAEAAIDGQTALLVDPGDGEGLARAIVRLFCDPVLAQKLAACGARYVAEEFSAARMARETLQVYTSTPAFAPPPR